MKWKFELKGEIKGCTPAREQKYFAKACNLSGSFKNSIEVGQHREWVVSVIEGFAIKSHLTFAQACQVMKTGSFTPAYYIHSRMEKNEAPETADLHLTFMKDAWSWAISIRNLTQHVSYAAGSDSHANDGKLAKKLVAAKGAVDKKSGAYVST